MTSALISPHDAHALIQNNPNVIVFDASYPPQHSVPVIPNALQFDIDEIADPHNSMPHMVPSPELFSSHMQRMGVKNSDQILIYDSVGIHMAAARAWWMMRLFGHDDVRVINGGFPQWLSSGLPISESHKIPMPTSEAFKVNFREHLLVNLPEMKHIAETQSASIFDARPRERFLGLSPEPRPNMRAGHMPNAVNVPTGSLIDPQTGGLKSAPPLPEFDSNDRIVTTCGSGVTACVIALALFESGKTDAAVYDGSWAEWGNAESNTLSVN
jgi:thiosulfate/3-mercaptopyruvate sulfurtransferase